MQFTLGMHIAAASSALASGLLFGSAARSRPWIGLVVALGVVALAVLPSFAADGAVACNALALCLLLCATSGLLVGWIGSHLLRCSSQFAMLRQRHRERVAQRQRIASRRWARTVERVTVFTYASLSTAAKGPAVQRDFAEVHQISEGMRTPNRSSLGPLAGTLAIAVRLLSIPLAGKKRQLLVGSAITTLLVLAANALERFLPR